MLAVCLPFHSITVQFFFFNFHLFTFVHRAKVFYYVISYTKGMIMYQNVWHVSVVLNVADVFPVAYFDHILPLTSA